MMVLIIYLALRSLRGIRKSKVNSSNLCAHIGKTDVPKFFIRTISQGGFHDFQRLYLKSSLMVNCLAWQNCAIFCIGIILIYLFVNNDFIN